MNNLARNNKEIYEEINGDFWIGLAYVNITSFDDDVVLFLQKAIKHKNYQAIAYLNLGQVLVRQGKHKEAIDCLHEATQIFSEWSLPFYYRCQILWEFDKQLYSSALIEFIQQFPHHGLEMMYLLSLPILDTPIGDRVKLPEKLYHYTDDAGIKGIIENKKLWLTRIDFLNDPSERNYFIKVLESMINRAKYRGKKSRNIQFAKDLEVLKELFVTISEVVYGKCLISDCITRNHFSNVLTRKQFRDIVEHSVKYGFDKYYVLSLTKRDDDLPLWSMYCQNEGYNIEFDTTELVENMINYQKDNVQLESYVNLQSRVLYNHGDVYDFIKHLYDTRFIHIKNLRTRITGLFSVAIVGSAFIKNRKFNFENESRIVVAKMDNPNSPETYSEVQFRVRNDTLIPYIEVPITNGTNWPIKSVKLGPKNKKDTSLPGIRLLLEKHGLSNINISNSDIPLR